MPIVVAEYLSAGVADKRDGFGWRGGSLLLCGGGRRQRGGDGEQIEAAIRLAAGREVELEKLGGERSQRRLRQHRDRIAFLGQRISDDLSQRTS